MKTLLPIIGILFLFISSCQKSDDDSPAAPIENNPDDIVYQDLNPNIILHPVDSFGLHPTRYACQKTIPYPSDSIVTAEIDINGDGLNDFRFTYKTFYEFVSASGPCANYNSASAIVD